MITGAPPGFMRYETEYPDQVVALTPAILPDDLLDGFNAANREWNTSIASIQDAVWRSMSPADMNHWRILERGQAGVCHDFAVTKRKALMAHAGALSLAFCHREFDASNLDHLVLLARFASGVRVLDNLFYDFYPLEDCDYEFISRQTWGNPQQWETM